MPRTSMVWGGPEEWAAACWSIARRGLSTRSNSNKLDAASISIVELMHKLLPSDARARNEKMDHAARHLLRQLEAPPLSTKYTPRSGAQ